MTIFRLRKSAATVTGCLAAAVTLISTLVLAAGPVPVTVENFVKAESDTYFRLYAGGSPTGVGRSLGQFTFARDVSAVDHQTTVRQNRDTLYGIAVFDLAAGPVTITLPDPGGRFMSLQLIDQEQYSPAIYYGAGAHTLTQEQIGTRYVIAASRVFIDANDPADIETGRELEDAIIARQPGGPGKLELPDWDQASLKKVRDALLVLASTIPDSKRMFGPRGDVDPLRHLIGTASLWGGNRPEDATYLNVTPPHNDGATIYRLSVPPVPVDGFWSISLYNAQGYFEPNALGAYSLNNVTAKADADGQVAIQFGGCDGKIANCLPTVPGWNYMVRLHRPRTEILDGTWKFPEAEPAN